MGDLIDYAKAQLPSQFQDKENWNKYLEATISTPEEIKDNSMILFDLDQSSGSELDVIGEIVGRKRNSKNDNDYRQELRLYAKINNSNSTPENIIFATKSLVNSNQMFYTEGNYNEVALYINFKELPSQEIIETLRKCVAGGIKLTIYYTDNIEIFYNKAEQYQLFANGEQLIANDNDISVSFGVDGQNKRFTQPLFANGDIIYANGQPLAIDWFDEL